MADLSTIDGYGAPSGAAIGSGMIVMWHGTIANIPAGYVICDGNNSTPNLLDQFIQSVPTAVTDPGGTGGATTQPVSNHRHNTPNHSHTSSTFGAPSATQNTSVDAGSQEMSSSNHSHYASSVGPDGAVFGGYNTASVTDGRPKYYAVAFLMKT